MRLWFITIFLGLCFAYQTSDAETVHVVQKSETLYSIGKAYSLPVDKILKANSGLSPNKLRVGQRIVIPTEDSQQKAQPAVSPSNSTSSSNIYVTQEGDTIASISRSYKIPIEELKARNNLDGDKLEPGTKITLRESPPATPNKKASDKKMDYVFVSKVQKKIDSPDQLRPWKYIVVHHSGTPNGNAKIFDYFHSHIRGMENGMAYHFVIGNGSDSGDGEIEVGNRWLKQLQGGHLHSDELNEISIGICLVGDFSKSTPTKAQTASLIELVTYLQKKCASSHPKFCVHREINPTPTQCPGKAFPAKTFHQLFD